MFSTLSSRRSFAARFASLFTGAGVATLLADSGPAAGQAPSGVQKLDYEGKTAGTGFITPLVIHNGVIYIAGQGAHSHDSSEFPMDVETHTKKRSSSAAAVPWTAICNSLSILRTLTSTRA